MASLKRANTWEVSDSEGEQTPSGPGGHSPAKDDDHLDLHSKTETSSSEPHCKTKTVSLDPHSKAKTVRSDPPCRTETNSSDPHCKTNTVSLDPPRKTKTVRSDPHCKTKMVSLDPHCKTETNSSGHQSKPKTVSSDPHCEADPVRLDSLIPQGVRGSRAPSVSPGRKRRTQEEREQERARVEERRAERERARAERERAKEEKRQEQRWRREEAERVRSLKPENCLRSLKVHVHPVLLQDCGCDVLLGALGGLEWSHCIEEHSLTHSISWTRQTAQVHGEDGAGVVAEDQVLMVISQREFMDMVTSIKQELIGGSEGAESLFQPLSEYLNHNSGTVVSLLVTGAQHTQRALCDSTDLGFCLDGSWSGGVRVDGSGRGLVQVWTRQIQQLNRVSAAMATAVTSAYPSPSLLLQAYEEAKSEEEQRKLLADLTVKGGAKERRVGPDLSNRVHRLMTSQNPQLVLD
ncbi:crossover junction endonuclease EME1 isoform X2 [Pygocentrus nattereri]|uniref:ERCC4 domain-containing protein n=1 Tax=Pygocentrus nattereri TaxID=42514 RepID=A0A3B4E6S8_PYGNA|nr:crossover junction endonuclease EME1 isoform X2 [Pygocentrus nattereri]